MKHSRRRSRAEAEQLAVEYETSGLSRSEFCRQHGLSLNTLSRYCARRRAEAARSDADDWVEVEIHEAGARNQHRGGELWLHVGRERRIEIRRGFDPSTLEQILRVLERV